MKKEYLKYAVIIFFLGIFVGYLTFNKDTRDTAISSFEKKGLCANYRTEAQTQLDETYQIATPYFYDIFYSPKTDSCLYTHGLILMGTAPEEIGSFVIADYFSGETLFSIKYDNSSEDEAYYSYNKRPIFSEEVKNYK